MIYLEQRFDIHPASPATRDRFVEAAESALLPASREVGARLVGAWFAHDEWFSRITHVTELEDLQAYAAWRDATDPARGEPALAKACADLASLAPERGEDLLEPLGPIAPDAVHQAIAAAGDEPVGDYTFAVLDVAPGQMERFSELLGAAAGNLPIIACWRRMTGNPSQVIDLWKGDIGADGYRPSSPALEAFFGPLRDVAPREKLVRLHPMPYSPLR